MSLSSVLNTACTALSAAEFALGVTAHNMANAQTDGYKAWRTVFTPGPVLSDRLGAAPTGRFGGTNPIQVGTGVQVGAIVIDERPGSLLPIPADPNLPVSPDASDSLNSTGFRELSNYSVDQGLIDLTLNTMMFRTNLQVFRTANALFDELLNLRRL